MIEMALWRVGSDEVKDTVLGKEANIVCRKQINAGRPTWVYGGGSF